MIKTNFKIALIVLTFSLISFLSVNNAKGMSVEELISKYHESKKDLKTYKLIRKDLSKQTVVPKSGIKSNMRGPTITQTQFNQEGVVDIQNKKMFLTVRQRTFFPEFPKLSDQEGLSGAYDEYVIDNLGYLENKFYVNGKLKEGKWHKSTSLADAIWKAADIFYIFRGFKGLEEYGLRLQDVLESKIDEKDCYCINYMISDSERFKRFVGPEGGIVFIEEFVGIKNKTWDIKSFSLKAYISKKTYFPVMYDLKLNVAVSPKNLIDVDFKEVIHEIQQTSKIYDYNKPVNIQLPKEAQEAEEVK